MRQMYRLCIFDLDGTLLDTIHALTLTTNRVLAHFGLKETDEAHMKLFVGNGYKTQMERSLKWAGDETLQYYEASLPVYLKEFEEHCLYRVAPYEGIREMLTFLKQQGVKIAVLSNKPHERTVENIEYAFGKGYFDAITGEREGVPKKPDPQGVFALAKELDINLSDCLYFGDTNTDMETGKNAGVDTVGVLWGFRDRKELEAFGPNYIIESPLEVKQIFEEKICGK